MKHTYIKPQTELVSSELQSMIAASPVKTVRWQGGQMKWDQDGITDIAGRSMLPTDGDAFQIKDAVAGSTFTHGQSADGTGNRSKGSAWDSWD